MSAFFYGKSIRFVIEVNGRLALGRENKLNLSGTMVVKIKFRLTLKIKDG